MWVLQYSREMACTAVGCLLLPLCCKCLVVCATVAALHSSYLAQADRHIANNVHVCMCCCFACSSEINDMQAICKAVAEGEH